MIFSKLVSTLSITVMPSRGGLLLYTLLCFGHAALVRSWTKPSFSPYVTDVQVKRDRYPTAYLPPRLSSVP